MATRLSRAPDCYPSAMIMSISNYTYTLYYTYVYDAWFLYYKYNMYYKPSRYEYTLGTRVYYRRMPVRRVFYKSNIWVHVKKKNSDPVFVKKKKILLTNDIIPPHHRVYFRHCWHIAAYEKKKFQTPPLLHATVY